LPRSRCAGIPALPACSTAPSLVASAACGDDIPDAIALRLTPQARRVPDTDWHIARL